MKYFLIAGEASGDLHGANLIQSIKRHDKKAAFAFWGGDLMANQAVGLMQHYKEIAIMGFIEVIMRLGFVLKNLNRCKAQISSFNPDVVVLIDYPGFNFRIAEYCKKNGIKVVWYIAPKVWAWKEKRAHKLEKYVDELLLIFPFEQGYFKKWRVKSTYVGNPLLDEISSFKPNVNFIKEHGFDSHKEIIALLPGSRKQEIKRMLPTMMELADKYPDFQFVVAAAPSIESGFYLSFLKSNCTIVYNQTYELLHVAKAAIVCSGTATLETALFNVPQVCAYAANPLSIAIARLFVKVKYISLVNLVLQNEAICELIQDEYSISTLQKEFGAILPGGIKHEQLIKNYSALKDLLGKPGASDRAATIISALTVK